MQAPYLNLRPSMYLALMLAFTQAGALLTLFFLPMAKFWLLLIAGLCLISCMVSLRQHAFKSSPRAIVTLRALADNQWALQDRRGQIYQGGLLGNSFISSWLLILNFKLANQPWPKTVLVAKDALDSDQYRHLVAYLRTAIKPKI